MFTSRLIRPVAAGLAAVAASAALAGAGAAPASAGTVRTICNAQNVYLRTEPQGPAIDNLPAGSHFEVSRYSPSGGWAYGYSYWDGQRGWIDSHYLC